jgi:site-specific DNA-methyltransferase (cytosine-N4-specific)
MVEQKILTQLDSNLANLEEWNFNGYSTQYSTHGIHTWLAAMNPSLARKLISLTKPKKLLDPFCGGGAVLVEGMLQGVEAVGVDINPLAVIISKAKTTPIDKTKLEAEQNHILEYVKEHPKDCLSFPKSYLIDFWFKPETLNPLSAIANAVTEIRNEKIKTFFQCVLSATARDVSLTYRNEIRLRRLVPDDLSKFSPDVVKQFVSRSNFAIGRVSEISRNAKIKVCHANTAENLPFKKNEFSTIICSPPYGDERNGVPYFQFSKNMLFWLKISKEQLLSFKEETLGWVGKRGNWDCPDSPKLKSLIESVSHNKRTKVEALAFYCDYFRALKNMTRVTSDKIVIVIGQRVLLNNVFDNARITTEFMISLGARLDASYNRKLPSKRLPKMREYGAAIDTESILIYDLKNKVSE